ncbi:MAG: glycosyltransferase family 4 protein [Acidobacteriota bacterium]
MNVLHVIQRYEPAIGGAETWCREVSRRQVRLGHRVRVVTLDIVDETEFWSEAAGDDRCRHLGALDLDHGVEVRRFHRSLPPRLVHHLLLRGLCDGLLDRFMLGPHSAEMMVHLDAEVAWADVVHLHSLPYPHNGLGLRAARRAGRPVVLTPHWHVGHRDYERPHQFRLLRRVDRLVAVTRHEKAVLIRRGVQAERIVVSGNGAPAPGAVPDRRDARRWLGRHAPVADGDAVVVCLARQMREKGLETLVRAVERLREDGRRVWLVTAGPQQDWFARWVSARSASGRGGVIDVGRVSDEAKGLLLAAADVFAMPSLHEAFGIVFLEAWQAGLPVIGGDSAAQREVIGRGGCTVPFGDVSALAAAMSLYLDDPTAAREAVACGKQALSERFNWDAVVSVVESCYAGLEPPVAARKKRPISGTAC